MTNPDLEDGWTVSVVGQVKYIFGVLHQYEWSHRLSMFDWFEVPGQPIAVDEKENE